MYRNNILDAVKNVDKIYIAGHTNPDGDAIGAVLAFALFLKQKGKTPYVLLESIPARYSFLFGREMLFTGSYDDIVKPELFFAVDTGDKARLGAAAQVFDKALCTYCIDHHRTNVGFADYNIINADASSASEIMFEIMLGMGFDPVSDKEISTNLYSGIVFDTSGFKHNCTSKRTHEIAGVLLEAGVDTSFIHSKILYEHTFSQARLFGVAFSNMQHKQGVTFTTLTKAELSECGCTTDDLDGIVDFLLNLDVSECAVLVTERDNNTAKASVRSKKFYISDIVASLGGGGHALAAGVTCEGSAAEVAEKVVNLITDGLKNGQ